MSKSGKRPPSPAVQGDGWQKLVADASRAPAASASGQPAAVQSAVELAIIQRLKELAPIQEQIDSLEEAHYRLEDRYSELDDRRQQNTNTKTVEAFKAAQRALTRWEEENLPRLAALWGQKVDVLKPVEAPLARALEELAGVRFCLNDQGCLSTIINSGSHNQNLKTAVGMRKILRRSGLEAHSHDNSVTASVSVDPGPPDFLERLKAAVLAKRKERGAAEGPAFPEPESAGTGETPWVGRRGPGSDSGPSGLGG